MPLPASSVGRHRLSSLTWSLSLKPGLLNQPTAGLLVLVYSYLHAFAHTVPYAFPSFLPIALPPNSDLPPLQVSSVAPSPNVKAILIGP